MKSLEDYTRKEKLRDGAISVFFICLYPIVWAASQITGIIQVFRKGRK